MTRPSRKSRRAPAGKGAEPLATTVDLVIDNLATGGEGVGRDDQGRVVFVPGSAPGDKARVRLVERKKRFARGQLVEVVEPGPGRVTPPCPLFVQGRCGGCQWQHLDAAIQQRAKADICARELRRQVAGGMDMRPIIAAVPGYGWRRRARLQYVRARGARAAMIGMYGPRSHRITDVAACAQLEDALGDALAVIRADLAPHLGSRGEISMIAGAGSGSGPSPVHVAIRGWCAPRYAARLVGKGGSAGTIVGVVLHAPPAKRGRPGQAAMEWGEQVIALDSSEHGALGLMGSADHFAQASRAGNRVLVQAVDEACGPRAGKRVIEFYAGVGNFTRILVQDAAEVFACDNVAVPWLPELRQGLAEEVARALVDQGERFDLAVLDPPRAGARELMEPLAALEAGRIVYVSCDPATLARDIQVLEDAGYKAVRAQPLDLMPQTAHVEVVVTLLRQLPG